MKAIIIEDEEMAAKRLQKLLLEIDPEIDFVGTADSIESSIQLFENTPDYDIVFMDIHLADGSSFEIFQQITITKPLIFVTAYDEYAVKAFKVNALDYILKPVKKAELSQAYEKMSQTHIANDFDYKRLADAIQQSNYKKRFLVRIGKQMKVIEIKDIAYVYTKDRITFLMTFEGKRYPLELSLDKLEETLDQRVFFRINRQFIIALEAIQEMLAYSKARVKLTLQPPCDIETIVSTERSPTFKKWLVGE